MKNIRYWPVFLLAFCITCSFAKGQSIILTGATIQSLEHCTAKQSVQLSCRSYRQTTAYTCAPAVVMALMNYYGLLGSKDMNQQTEMRIASEMGTTKEGTSSSQIESWLRNHGFSVESGRRITTDAIIENIHKKIPTIVEFSNHWILAKGYSKGATPAEDEIIFSDSCCSVKTLSRKIIDSMWGESQIAGSDCRSNVGAYIVAIKR